MYDFTVFLAPSVPNDGTSHLSSSYVTTALTSSLTFGPISTPGLFYTATNLNSTTVLAVQAGDRVGIRIRTQINSCQNSI